MAHKRAFRRCIVIGKKRRGKRLYRGSQASSEPTYAGQRPVPIRKKRDDDSTPMKAAQSAVIYARVSTREQQDEGYSIEAQLALLRAYADKQGLRLAGEFIESETAKVSGRPAFSAMLKLVKDQEVTAILVEKTDRLYRNLKDYVRVDDLGIEVHLVKEGEVISQDSRSHQKFVHGIKLLMAKNFSDNLSEEAKKGMLEKARQGLWPTKAPLGYLNVSLGSRRVIELDPERAELIRFMFIHYAEGMTSLRDLRTEMIARGLTTRQGRKVATNELHKILRNPVYYGLVCWAGEEHQGSHPPIIDKATFSRVQDVMTGRNQSKEKPGAAKDFIYRGLFRCGHCGCLMCAQETKGHRYYACTGARGCTRKAVREELITEAIADKLSGMAIRPEVLDLLRQALRESDSDENRFREAELSALHKAEKDLMDRLRQLYLDKVSGSVPVVIYNEYRPQWEEELGVVKAKILSFSHARRRYEDEGLKLIDFASNVYSRFKEAEFEDKRDMAKSLLSNSTITDGKVEVCLHKAFEMILEANREMADNQPENSLVGKWLAD